MVGLWLTTMAQNPLDTPASNLLPTMLNRKLPGMCSMPGGRELTGLEKPGKSREAMGLPLEVTSAEVRSAEGIPTTYCSGARFTAG